MYQKEGGYDEVNLFVLNDRQAGLPSRAFSQWR